MMPETWIRRWWRGDAGLPGSALDALAMPLEAGFRAGVTVRDAAYRHGLRAVARARIPVISVGNLTVGGTGKTPVVGWLARRLADAGRRPAVLLRGAGGDEEALHRAWNPDVPVVSGSDRVAGALLAAGRGCDVALLDDGFQHRRLARDVDVVLVAAEQWTLRPRLLPRGPWREPLSALARADLVVVTRKSATDRDADAVVQALRELHPAPPTARIALLPRGLRAIPEGREESLAILRGIAVVAVAAVAWPDPFLRHLHDAGAIAEPRLYPDHHPFSRRDVEGILERSGGRPIVTTAKDAVKLRPLLPEGAEAWVLEQDVLLEDGADALDAACAGVLSEGGG
jgi:tetraacyldisaccharide 4'-kinase